MTNRWNFADGGLCQRASARKTGFHPRIKSEGRLFPGRAKRPGIAVGPLSFSERDLYRKTGLELGRLFLDHRVLFGLRLRTAVRSLGQRGLDLLDRFGLREPLHGGDFTRQPVERRLVELALGIGLLRLRLRAKQIADDLG